MRDKLKVLVRSAVMVSMLGPFGAFGPYAFAEVDPGQPASAESPPAAPPAPAKPTGQETAAKPSKLTSQTETPFDNRGGFFESMAGGIAGGFLGGLFFRTFGTALGMDGPSNGYGNGGLGLLDILLIIGLGYLAFRWWLDHRGAGHD